MRMRCARSSTEWWSGAFVTGVSKKVDDIVKALRITAQVKELLPQTDRIHVRNGAFVF